jgi:hypothetical protein
VKINHKEVQPTDPFRTRNMRKSVVSNRSRQPPAVVDVDFTSGGGCRRRLEHPLEDPLESEVPKEVETTTPATIVTVTKDPPTSNSKSEYKVDNHRTATIIHEEEETEREQDIEGVIDSFKEELENLERSFNELASSQQSLRTRHSGRTTVMEESRENSRLQANSATATTTPSRYTNYLLSERPSTSATESRLPDPDPTTPLRFSTSSTPQRGSNSMNMNRTGGVSYDDGLEPRNRSYRSSTSYGVPPDPVETPLLQQPHAVDRSGSGSHTRNRSTSSNDFELTLDRMKETLSQQQRRIQDLERENKDLRRMLDEVGRRQSPSPQQPQHPSYSYGGRRSGHHQQPEDLASRGMTFRSTQLSTPPRDNDYQDDFDTLHRRQADVLVEHELEFTPGTRFVAELARLMKMEHGHHAPLSVMLDKHWDRLKYHMRDDC